MVTKHLRVKPRRSWVSKKNHTSMFRISPKQQMFRIWPPLLHTYRLPPNRLQKIIWPRGLYTRPYSTCKFLGKIVCMIPSAFRCLNFCDDYKSGTLQGCCWPISSARSSCNSNIHYQRYPAGPAASYTIQPHLHIYWLHPNRLPLWYATPASAGKHEKLGLFCISTISQ